MGQGCSMIELGTGDILIEMEFILARNPMLTYITTKSTLEDDKNTTFQDKNNILIPGSRMSFSKGVRNTFFFICLHWSLSILSSCCQQFYWRQNGNFFGFI